MQKNEKLKREAAENILAEVAERKRHETNVIVYNLREDKSTSNIELLLSNYPEAPFKEEF